MAYTSTNFKTKKELKQAVKEGNQISIFLPGPFGCNQNGTEVIEGPQYPQPHRWYSQVTVKDGIIITVK